MTLARLDTVGVAVEALSLEVAVVPEIPRANAASGKFKLVRNLA